MLAAPKCGGSQNKAPVSKVGQGDVGGNLETRRSCPTENYPTVVVLVVST